MATEVSSIDDLLASGKSLTQPAAPENQYGDPAEEVPELEGQAPEQLSDAIEPVVNEEAESVEATEEKHEKEIDDYGNEKPEPKTYSEDEVSERINKAVRERMARMERNTPQPEPQQQAKPEFEYNPESEESWQNQLEGFVEQTVSKMTSKK